MRRLSNLGKDLWQFAVRPAVDTNVSISTHSRSRVPCGRLSTPVEAPV